MWGLPPPYNMERSSDSSQNVPPKTLTIWNLLIPSLSSSVIHWHGASTYPKTRWSRNNCRYGNGFKTWHPSKNVLLNRARTWVTHTHLNPSACVMRDAVAYGAKIWLIWSQRVSCDLPTGCLWHFWLCSTSTIVSLFYWWFCWFPFI